MSTTNIVVMSTDTTMFVVNAVVIKDFENSRPRCPSAAVWELYGGKEGRSMFRVMFEVTNTDRQHQTSKKRRISHAGTHVR